MSSARRSGRRIGIAGYVHETATDADEVLGPTAAAEFRILTGAAVLDAFAGTDAYVGGMLRALRRAGTEPVPLVHAEAEPSGTIAAAAHEQIVERIVTAAAAAELDAILLELHGAGVAASCDDVELDLLARLRAAVGPAPPIAVTLDLHANLDEDMAGLVDGIFPVRRYPHDDQAEAGEAAVSRVLACLDDPRARDRHRPLVRRLPMTIAPTTTAHDPGAALLRWSQELEARPEVSIARICHGFPYTDTPVTGASVVAAAETPRVVHEVAEEAASRLWAHRRALLPDPLEPPAAIAVARRHLGEGRPQPVLVNEASDNTGGGAPGDATHLLAPLLDAQIPGSAFGFLVDAEAAASAHRLGAGATARMSLGGRHGRYSGQPVEADVAVVSCGYGRFRGGGVAAGRMIDLGPTARLRAGACDVIVASRRQQTLCPGVFELHGIDVAACSIVALKSSHHFRAGFEGLAGRIVTAEGAGLTSTRFGGRPRSRLRRPLWPLDHEAALDDRPFAG